MPISAKRGVSTVYNNINNVTIKATREARIDLSTA